MCSKQSGESDAALTLVTPKRSGRPTEGLYPHVSRTQLARVLGYGKSAVSWMLRGRLRIDRLSVAIPLAQAVGISVEQLQRDWQEERERYEARDRVARAARAAAQATRKARGKGSERETKD